MQTPIKIQKDGYYYEIVDSNNGDINGKYTVYAQKENNNLAYELVKTNTIKEAKRIIEEHYTFGYFSK